MPAILTASPPFSRGPLIANIAKRPETARPRYQASGDADHFVRQKSRVIIPHFLHGIFLVTV